MRIAVFLLVLGLTAAQAPEAIEVALFKKAYDAVRTGLPAGPHAVIVSDDFGRERGWRDSDGVVQSNRAFAKSIGLRADSLSRILTCKPRWHCQFVDDVVASVSFRVVSKSEDSARVEVTTRYFMKTNAGMAPGQAAALSEVRLVRRGGAWVVVTVGTRAES
jgi:hypothetical protein